MIAGHISEKTATALLYGLQIASANPGRLTFPKASAEMVVNEPAQPAATEERCDANGPDPSIYEELDQDLKLKLQEIGAEFHRRVCEKYGVENGPAGPCLERE